jgi:DNA-binding FadR family transcriptional regulator
MTGQTTSARAHMSRGELATHLEAQVCSGALPAGARLPSERQLAERYGVSRPIVREALRSLVERGLVEVLPARGSFVRGARATDAAGVLDTLYRRSQATPRDLVEARTMLECTAAALAAERASAEDLEQIDAALTRFDLASSVVERARYDLVFHLAVARAAHNPVIETMFGSITGLTVDLMLRSLSDRAVTDASVPYHAEIRNAIGARNPERARLAMAEHLSVASRFYGADYETSLENLAQRHLARLLEPGSTLDRLLDEAAPAAGWRGYG